MPLPGSGLITLTDIEGEFGGPTNPIALTNYYRGGGLVPDISSNSGVPTSGLITLTDFYGAENVVLSLRDWAPEAAAPVAATLTIFNDGDIGGTPTNVQAADWSGDATKASGFGDDWHVRSTIQSGTLTSDPSAGSWIALTSDRAWTRAGAGTVEVLYEFSLDAGSTVFDSVTVNFTVT